jgi:glycosyltransferase involved in cell wall biosynthesis
MPDSDLRVFTIYSELQSFVVWWKKIAISTALPRWLNDFFVWNAQKKIPILAQLFDYRNLMLVYPLLMKIISWKIEYYRPKKILISSFAIAKNIEQCKKNTSYTRPEIELYLHSPMQYIWSHVQEYRQKLTGWKWVIFRQLITYLRRWDLKYTQYDKIYVNSVFTQDLAKTTYGIVWVVKYPKLQKKFFDESVVLQPNNYVVCVGRIVKFVREVDLIIKAFNTIGYPLVIIGSGPDEQELRKIAKKNITFMGWNPPDMIKTIKHARWLINLTKESFGLSTAEALCLGVPVLGYQQGATAELLDNDSWILLQKKTIEEIEIVFSEFIKKHRDRKTISSRARLLFNSKI